MKENIAVLLIDLQNDFIEETGALQVPGALEDVERGASFIDENRKSIKDIYASFDMHSPMQIFHPDWWIDSSTGENVKPFTPISSKEIKEGKYVPVIEPEWSLMYVEILEKAGRFQHTIWPQHCLLGTWGQRMHPIILSSVNAWQKEYGSAKSMRILNKGWEPKYEYFGIFKPEGIVGSFKQEFAKELDTHDKIISFGQAKSHCFGISIEQLLDEARLGNNVCKSILSKMIVLSDCTSNITGYSKDQVFVEAQKYGLQMKKHDSFKL